MNPSAEEPALTLRPVAVVRCDVEDDEVAPRRRQLISRVEVFPRYRAGLDGIDEYSHLFVLFWMHRVAADDSLRWHPRGDRSLPATGVFASRGRNHPNPLGLAVVELLGVADNVLTVRRLDAFDGTPVLDIKPYDDYDVVAEPRVPAWFRERARRRR